jgi:hypothetical protein
VICEAAGIRWSPSWPRRIPAFTPLLRLVKAVLGSLDGVLVVADALHAQVGHAELLAVDGAHLMVTAKLNGPPADYATALLQHRPASVCRASGSAVATRGRTLRVDSQLGGPT